jgi:hypothetical protein
MNSLFDTEDPLKKKAIFPQPLPEEAKKAVYDDLLSKYESIKERGDADYAKEKDRYKEMNPLLDIGRAISLGASAKAESMGAKPNDLSGFDRIQSGLKDKLSISDMERKKTIEDYLTGVKLGQSDDLNKANIHKLKYGSPISAAERERLDIQRDMLDVRKNESEFKKNNAARTSRKDEMAEERHTLAMDRESKKDAREEDARFVVGYGVARTPKDAQEFKLAAIDSESAIADLNEVIKLGKDIGPLDLDNRALIGQKLDQAVGKLRLSMVGPGAMTDSERTMIRKAIGDPRNYTSFESTEIKKLDQLINNIKNRLNLEASFKIKDYKDSNTEVPIQGGSVKQPKKSLDWDES